MVRVMEHKSSSGSTTRSASGAEESRSARAGCRGRASEVAFPGASGDEVDVLCRLAGNIEQASFRNISRVCALGCGLVTDNEEILSDVKSYKRLVKCLALKNEVTRRSAVDVHARHSNVHSSTHATSNSCSELSGSFPKVSDRALFPLASSSSNHSAKPAPPPTAAHSFLPKTK